MWPFSTSTTVNVDIENARKAWEGVQEIYEKARDLAELKADEKKLTPAEMRSLRKLDREFIKLDAVITAALSKPGSTMDWEAVVAILAAVAKIAL